MPCTPAVLNLLVEKMWVQVREEGTGKVGGTRASSNSSSSSTRRRRRSSGRSNLSTVAAGVEPH